MIKLTGLAPVSIRGPRPLPFVGVHVNALRLLADPIGRMTALHREYGNIAAIADGSPVLVCAFGAEHNREVLSNPAVFENDDGVYMETRPGTANDSLAKGLVFQTGERHRRHRRLMMPAFQKAAIDGYAPAIVSVADAVLRTWPVGQTADVSDLTRTLVQGIAVRCLFGLDGLGGDREIGDLAAEWVDLVTSPLGVMLPFDIPGTPHARLLRVCDRYASLLKALIDEKRRRLPGANDALALMLQAGVGDKEPLSDEELIGEANTLFVAGHDTQAKTLAWTLFLLEQHPKVLSDVLDELDAVLRGGLPSPEHVQRLVLLDRVIKESMRILPPVPVSFIRVCQSEARLGSVTLPKGGSVILSQFVTHRDPERYPEPARFRPERWEKLQPTVYEYLPFGAGARMCIGAGFATLALRLVLPMILQRYRFSLAFGARVSRLVRGNILGPRYGLPMLIAPQDRRLTRRERVRGDIPGLLDLS